jgi:hypothetical protein
VPELVVDFLSCRNAAQQEEKHVLHFIVMFSNC